MAMILVLAACGGKHPEVVEVPAPAHEPVVLAASQPEFKSGVVPPAAEPTPTVQEPLSPARQVPPGRPVLPPVDPGKVAWRADGCLALAKGSAEDDKRFPAAMTRASQADVTVSVMGVGAIVTHTLRHACCLHGDVQAHVRGQDIEVREVLTGDACRCMCASTVKTAVGLKPGQYTLRVVVVTGGVETEVARKPVEIR
jgi:hypothetical protein